MEKVPGINSLKLQPSIEQHLALVSIEPHSTDPHKKAALKTYTHET